MSFPKEGQKRRLLSPLKRGDYVAYEEEWADMSGDGDYMWCPIWIKRAPLKEEPKKTISYKEIVKELDKRLFKEKKSVVGDELPGYYKEFIRNGKRASIAVMDSDMARQYWHMGINYYSLIRKLGYSNEDEIMAKAGFALAQEGKTSYWFTNRRFYGSSDGYRNRGFSKKEVGFEDALKILHPKELDEEKKKVEEQKKKFFDKYTTEWFIDYSDYEIVE